MLATIPMLLGCVALNIRLPISQRNKKTTISLPVACSAGREHGNRPCRARSISARVSTNPNGTPGKCVSKARNMSIHPSGHPLCQRPGIRLEGSRPLGSLPTDYAAIAQRLANLLVE